MNYFAQNYINPVTDGDPVLVEVVVNQWQQL